jgi:MOSC domain-containing protein YiiM
LVAQRRPGFYLRVLEKGEVGASDRIGLVERGAEAMTVAEIDGLLYLPRRARRDLKRACPDLRAERGLAGIVPGAPRAG